MAARQKAEGDADASVRWVHYSELVPWAGNPNTHPETQPAQIAESIRSFGFVSPAVVWPKEKMLVAGHGRLLAMRLICETGYDYLDADGKMKHRGPDPGFTPEGAPKAGYIRVLFHDFADAAKARLYAVADNELARLAKMDEDTVKGLIRELEATGSLDGVHAIGFDFERLQSFIEAAPVVVAAPPKAAPPPPAPPTPDAVAPPAGPGTLPESRIVNWTVPMSPEERARMISVTNAAKRIGGVSTTREALMLIIADYESQHGLGAS